MAAKANTYEQQATLSVIAAGVGLVAAVAAVALVLRGFRWSEFSVVMGAQSKAYYMLLAAVGVSCLAGMIGLFAGFNSAGHARNKKSSLSWAGFFLGAVAFTIAASAFVFFYFTKELLTFGGS